MNAVLLRIQKGIDAVEKVVGPVDKIEEGEVVVGEITDVELQKLYTYFIKTADAIREKAERAEEIPETPGLHDEETCLRCQALKEILADVEFGDVVKKVFFYSVAESLSMDAKKITASSKSSGTAIREGWKIVSIPKKQERRGPIIIGLGLGRFPL